MTPPRLAIIGTGISGLGAAHFLQHDFEVTLFEKEAWVGGHAHTLEIQESSQKLPIDVGFIVYNEVTYPLLTRLFRELGVSTQSTTMSFSVQHLPDQLEYNGAGWQKLFAQKSNLWNRRFWKMLLQIDRFNRETVAELQEPHYLGMSLKEYVLKRGYGDDFLEWYLSPMAAAVWSSPPEKIAQFPAHTLMRFWQNHGFLGMHTHYPWRTVVGGSREYIQRLTAPFRDRIFTQAAIASVHSQGEMVEIVLESGAKHTFDRVIMAAHADQSLKMLGDPSSLEQELLSAFPYQQNKGMLHTSVGVLPKKKACWGAWNYRIEENNFGARSFSTHYWMNELQHLPSSHNYLVSLNPSSVITSDDQIASLEYEHPLFNQKAIEAQKRLPDLYQEGDHTKRYFCGAWQRYGFHEDGLLSAYQLATHLLGRDPWKK